MFLLTNKTISWYVNKNPNLGSKGSHIWEKYITNLLFNTEYSIAWYES